MNFKEVIDLWKYFKDLKIDSIKITQHIQCQVRYSKIREYKMLKFAYFNNYVSRF